MAVLPDDPQFLHAVFDAPDAYPIHYVRGGQGPAVLLLHGWPGFWYDWRHVIPALQTSAHVVAPDFRGFGLSGTPDLPPAEGYGPEAHVADLLRLLDHLGLSRVVVAGHDIGATIAQTLARKHPDRVASLVLFNPPYAGIGARRFDPAVQPEFWYQHLQIQPWSEGLVGRDRETIRLYLAHFYDHWVGNKAALDPEEFEAIVDAHTRPGVLRVGFNYYRARAGAKTGSAATAAAPAPLPIPTVVRWGKLDPVMRFEWSDRLGDHFSDIREFGALAGIGHFVPFEDPQAALDSIRRGIGVAETADTVPPR